MAEDTDERRIERARLGFRGVGKGTYLDTSSTGLMPEAARRAVETFLLDCADNGRTAADWEAALDGARGAFARLIGADPDDVAFTKNCTEGVNIVANGVPWQAGDNVVLCGELEHPANLYPWLNLRDRGLGVRFVPGHDQALDPDALLAACDDRTRFLAVSSVTFVPGFRTDLDRLGRSCRERGIFLIVDATQSAGVLVHDVRALPIDGLVTSTHKYLMGFYGQGFLWCRREWARRMRPAHLGKPGVAASGGHPADDGYAVPLRDDGRRLESGQLFVGAAALKASLDLLLHTGPAAIEAHAVALATRLAEGLTRLGLPVNRDPFGRPPTQVVTVGAITKDGLYEVSDPLLGAVHRHLAANGVRLSARRGQLRFSLHLYNDMTDVARVLDLAGEALAGAGRASAAE